jgi:hypothetical protein
MKQTKLEGTVSFFSEELQKIVSGPYSATIHLFEHEYDIWNRFSYGVAEVFCTLDEFNNNARVHLPNLSVLVLRLDDGRVGRASCLGFSNIFGPDADLCFRISFFGLSLLTQELK